MKKVNIQRNQLKFILILNDFYDILCYFRQPFFKLGNKTAQQITNLPIFLSFFIMFLSILQISFDTKNSSILKNYPLLVNLTNKKIPQKFETLYLQLDEIRRNERLLNDKQLINFQFQTNKPEYPTIFHQIQNSKQKQNTINLYKTFEQMGPILLSEIQKEEDPALLRHKEYQEDIIHLGVDIPYQSWSSNTKNFNVTEDKLLTNWRFNDSDLIIKDFKKGDLTNNASNIIQEFIVQYNNYVKEIENTKYISFKNLPFQKIQITQNSEKIFIKGPFRVLQPNETNEFLYKKSFLNNHKFKKGESTPPKGSSEMPNAGTNWPWAKRSTEKNTDLAPVCKYREPSSKNNRLAAINQNKGPDLSEKGLKKKIIQFQKGRLSSKEGQKALINSEKSQREILYLSNIKSQLSQILKEAMFVRLPVRTHIDKLTLTKKTRTGLADRTQPTPSKYTEDIVYQIQEIEDQIPMKIQGSQGVFAVGSSRGKTASHPLQETLQSRGSSSSRFWEDRRSLGLKAGQAFNPEGQRLAPFRPLALIAGSVLPEGNLRPGGPSTFADNILDKIYLFDENQYQEREYEVITYDKKVWDTLHKKLSNLHVQMPPFMEFVRQNHIDKKGVIGLRSLLNIKFISQGYHGLSEGVHLLKFLEFTKKKILKHSHFFRKLEKCQFKQLKYMGQFDLEIQETENHKNVKTQNICYNFKLGFLSQNQKDLVFNPSAFGQTQSFVENIWFIPKPQKVQWSGAFDAPFGGTGLELGLAPAGLGRPLALEGIGRQPKIAISLKNWNQKAIQRTGPVDRRNIPTFDNYIKKSSHLLQLQEENPYLFFDQIITPEDYLLETLFFFIKKNLTKFKEIYQQKEPLTPSEPSALCFAEGAGQGSQRRPIFGASEESSLMSVDRQAQFEAIPQNIENQGSQDSFGPGGEPLATLPCPSDPRQQSSSLINEKNQAVSERLAPARCRASGWAQASRTAVRPSAPSAERTEPTASPSERAALRTRWHFGQKPDRLKAWPGPSDRPTITSSISKILNYLNNRKKQRALAFKNSRQILQIKNLLEEKRKIQTSILYHSILNNYLLDPRILRQQQQNFRQKETSIQLAEDIAKRWPSSIERNPFKEIYRKRTLQAKHWRIWRQMPNWACLLKNNIFYVNFRKLQKKLLVTTRKYTDNVFFLLKKTNFKGQTPCPTAPWPSALRSRTGRADRRSPTTNLLLLNLYEFKEDLKFQLLWGPRLENTLVSLEGKGLETLGGNAFTPSGFGPEASPKAKSNFASCWVNLIKAHNEKKPYECMGKYYFIRKLPKIPQNVDHPVIAIQKPYECMAWNSAGLPPRAERSSQDKRIGLLPEMLSTDNKKSYPYRVINLPIMTSLKKIKINYGKEILTQLNDSISLQNQLYDQFFHIRDVFVQEISNPIHWRRPTNRHFAKGEGLKACPSAQSNKITEFVYKLSAGRWFPSIGQPAAKQAQGSQSDAASKYTDSEMYRHQRSLVSFERQAAQFDVLEDFYNDKDSEIHQVNKCLGQKQPIYQIIQGSRKMSGYIFPDLERKQLANLFKIFNPNIELEISISNTNVTVGELLKQLPDLQIQTLLPPKRKGEVKGQLNKTNPPLQGLASRDKRKAAQGSLPLALSPKGKGAAALPFAALDFGRNEGEAKGPAGLKGNPSVRSVAVGSRPLLEEHWTSKTQIFKHQQKISQKRFWDSPFFEFRENVNNYSWSIIFLLSSGWLFINLFKNLYKKYAKEFVESGIDFLKRAGILDDVQWIKEELGMAPIDKGYRGIRHPGIQRKKFKNIIGLERKHIISQVSEMVWFLKTKKLMKSTSIDPFVQIIFLLSRNYDSLITKTTKIRLMAKWRSRCPKGPTPRYVLKERLPSYAIIQKNLQILFPESKTYRTVEISPQQKETLRPFRFILEKLKDENEIGLGEGRGLKDGEASSQGLNASATKIQTESLDFLALKRNRNQVKPKGFLFTGPPGTGKTLLVQAIAGETSVPVVTQSGGLLQNPRLRGKGALTLHKLFLRAREIAPCIIFIDEIDGIGTRRQFLPLYIDIYGRYDPIEWLESDEVSFPPKIYQVKLQRRAEFLDDHDPYWEEPEFTQTVQSARIPIDVLQDLQFTRGARSEQLSMLTQLLIELDGLHSLENILVIGATNRLEILDPALMRPGRFQRILRFHLPNYHARINLLKLYTHSSKIGIENISWDYFSKRTHGLSSADIASIVFASELTAIQQSKTHTFETLERGIDLITSFPSDPVMFRLKNIFIFLENSLQKFFSKNHFHSIVQILANWAPRSTTDPKACSFDLKKVGPCAWPLQETSNIYRNCYYNIGKLVVLFCLQIMMPFSSAYISLWIRPKNFRFFFFTKNYEFDEFDQKMLSRKEIEKRLLAFFGGKAAESLFIFLPLHKFSSEIYFHFDQTFLSINNSLEQSNFGIDNEIQTAQSLLKLMVEKWYFYLERIATEKFHPILENVNLWEYSEKEIFLNQALIDEMIIDLDMRNRLSKNEQKYSYQTWWMKKVATRLNYRENFVLNWSRIYLSDPEDSPQNIEWVAPDEYFHTIFRTRPCSMAWTHFLENGRFAISNLLLLQSFNTVFKTLRQFSEFMDFLADYFLRYECIREIEFQTKISQFFRYLLP